MGQHTDRVDEQAEKGQEKKGDEIDGKAMEQVTEGREDYDASEKQTRDETAREVSKPLEERKSGQRGVSAFGFESSSTLISGLEEAGVESPALGRRPPEDPGRVQTRVDEPEAPEAPRAAASESLARQPGAVLEKSGSGKYQGEDYDHYEGGHTERIKPGGVREEVSNPDLPGGVRAHGKTADGADVYQFHDGSTGTFKDGDRVVSPREKAGADGYARGSGGEAFYNNDGSTRIVDSNGNVVEETGPDSPEQDPEDAAIERAKQYLGDWFKGIAREDGVTYAVGPKGELYKIYEEPKPEGDEGGDGSTSDTGGGDAPPAGGGDAPPAGGGDAPPAGDGDAPPAGDDTPPPAGDDTPPDLPEEWPPQAPEIKGQTLLGSGTANKNGSYSYFYSNSQGELYQMQMFPNGTSTWGPVPDAGPG